MSLSIVKMEAGHVDRIHAAFKSWNKTRAQYEAYFAENLAGQRITLVAELDGEVVGYGNLLRVSYYQPFELQGIPEINDLNVITLRQDQGIGRRLIERLESLARSQGHSQVGIGVGLGPGYERARRLYPNLGYVEDGRGAIQTVWGDEVHLTKRLTV